MRARPTKVVLIAWFAAIVLLAGCSQGSSQAVKQQVANIPAPSATPLPIPSVHMPGKVIVVVLSRQWLWAFQDKHPVFDTPVTTGMTELATPTGTYSVLDKVTDTWFTSAWPESSPYYYTPKFVHYALAFLTGGFYIHDASWRHEFGPGTNVPHTDSDGTQETGSHGCVEVSTSAGAWLYSWAPVGTIVLIEA